MSKDLVTVFGGSGFLGCYLVRQLAKEGFLIRVAVRDTEKAKFLRSMGDVGQISFIQVNFRDQASIELALKGAKLVVNLVGILDEKKSQRFEAIHVDGVEYVARAALAAGITQLVHVSAIGASKISPSKYGQTKAAGEKKLASIFPSATIIRPGVVFGMEDRFFNRIASLSSFMPILFLIGSSDGPRLQPIYVVDVAHSIVKVLTHENMQGRIYEVGGPEVVTLRDIYQLVLSTTGKKRFIWRMYTWVASILAFFSILFPLPSQLKITFDQIRQLKVDNVVSAEAKNLHDIGITPTPMSAVIPKMLERFRK